MLNDDMLQKINDLINTGVKVPGFGNKVMLDKSKLDGFVKEISELMPQDIQEAKEIINQKKKHSKLEGNIFKNSLNMCIISPSSVLVNRHLFNEYGMFRPWLKVCEDYELWLRFTSKVPIYLVNVPCVVKYGGHPGQLSKKHWGIDRFRVRALEKLILRFNLNKIQTKDTTNALISKIKVIISGAEKRKNKKIMKIYNFKKNYWKDKI